MERIKDATSVSGLVASPTQDAGPVHMSRSGGKGAKGSTFSLSNKAKYGLNEGVDVVRMKRTGGSGDSGKTFSLTHTGPTRMARSAKGSASHDATDFGVGGVSGSGGSTYGVGGI